MLSRVQSEWVGAQLQRKHPKIEVRYEWIESEGDQRADEPLARIGGKGLFAAAVEEALRRGRADLAIHSMKDLPANGGDADGLRIAAVPRRVDVRDCLISGNNAATIADLPHGAVLGTAGPRRAAQALRLRPDLNVQIIRGNIETRLRKVREGMHAPDGQPYQATLMACAGLLRAAAHHPGIADQPRAVLDTDTMLTAAGQGALALQCRSDDSVTLRRVLPMNEPISSQCVMLERQIVAALGGDCHSPIAALAEYDPDLPNIAPSGKAGKPGGYRIRARVLSPDGVHCIEAEAARPTKHVKQLVREVLKQLREGGAEAVLKASA